MEKLHDFTEMQVWQDSQQLVADVCADFGNCRDFSFCDQIKRAAVSISNNISEGSERSAPNDFARFLDIAKRSAGEVRNMYHLAECLNFLDETICASRRSQCPEISKQLSGFAKYLRSKKANSH